MARCLKLFSGSRGSPELSRRKKTGETLCTCLMSGKFHEKLIVDLFIMIMHRKKTGGDRNNLEKM